MTPTPGAARNARRADESAYSSVVHAARAETRIGGINASPEPVGKGRTITVQGVLNQLTPSRKALRTRNSRTQHGCSGLIP